MQILKVKDANEFETSEVPAGSLLVFPERQPDGSYLWRCRDSDGSAGTIGSADAVAENLSGEYGRPDSLLAQMMFFIRNGAVNLYATLADLKNFFSGYFASKSSEHSHGNEEILDKFSEDASGAPLYDGQSIGGGSSSGGALLSSDFFAVNPGVLVTASIGGGGSFTGGLSGVVDYATAFYQDFLTSDYQTV